MPRRPDNHCHTNPDRDRQLRPCYNDPCNCPIYVLPHDPFSYPPAPSHYDDGIRVRPIRESFKHNRSPSRAERHRRYPSSIRRRISPDRESRNSTSTDPYDNDEDLARDLHQFTMSRRDHPPHQTRPSSSSRLLPPSTRNANIPTAATTRNMKFDTAISLLAEITKQSITLFKTIGSEFEAEIELLDYTSTFVIDQLWKDKIEFNERGLIHDRPRDKIKDKNPDTDNDNDNSNHNDDDNDNTDFSSSPSSFDPSTPLPILSQTTTTLLTRLSVFITCTIPPSPHIYTPHLPSSTHRKQRQRTDACTALRRKVQALAPVIERLVEEARGDWRVVRKVVVELEGLEFGVAGWRGEWEGV